MSTFQSHSGEWSFYVVNGTKKEETKMKRRMCITLLATAALLSGCGKEQATEVVEFAGPEQQTESVETNETVQQEVETEVPDMEDMTILQSFVEEAAGKDTFESYDEVISYLTSGQAYAYVDVMGYEEPLLLVTESTYDDQNGNQASIDACIYMQGDNGVQYASVFSSEGTAYPLAINQNLLFQGGNHEIDVLCVSEDTQAIMYLASVYEEFDEDGNAHYGGFIRTNNLVSEDGEQIDTDDAEVLTQMRERYQAAEVINFTVVE